MSHVANRYSCQLLTYLLTHLLTYLLTHSLTYLLTQLIYRPVNHEGHIRTRQNYPITDESLIHQAMSNSRYYVLEDDVGKIHWYEPVRQK